MKISLIDYQKACRASCARIATSPGWPIYVYVCGGGDAGTGEESRWINLRLLLRALGRCLLEQTNFCCTDRSEKPSCATVNDGRRIVDVRALP